MHLEDLTIRLVEPGDDDQLGACGNPRQGAREGAIHVEPRIRGSFGTLPRRGVEPFERRSNVADRAKPSGFVVGHAG